MPSFTSFRTSACRPACSLTPAASYMTTAEKTPHTGKSTELRPNCSAMAVVRPQQSAECEEGMPPEAKRAAQSHTRVT